MENNERVTLPESPEDMLSSISVAPPPGLDDVPRHPVGRYIIGLALIGVMTVTSTLVVNSALSAQREATLAVADASEQAAAARSLEIQIRQTEPTDPADLLELSRQLEVGHILSGFETPYDRLEQLRTGLEGIVEATTTGSQSDDEELAVLSDVAGVYAAQLDSEVLRLQNLAAGGVDTMKQTLYILLSGTMVLLLLEGLFLFRPAARDLRLQWEEKIGSFQSEKEEDAKKLQYLARYDPLTGLINRTLFADRLDNAITRAKRNWGMVALMFLDVDGFKGINDRFGHATGDELLKEVANRISASVRESDTVARLGGDEFTVILEGIHHVDDVGRIASKILEAVSTPYRIAGRDLIITTSIGVAIYPIDGESIEELLKGADIAMYSAKENGRNQYQYFTSSMRDATSERLQIIDGLRHAIDEPDQFVLHYQPKVDISRHEVVGVEALIRWNHPEWGIVSPGKFIPIAEETDLIVQIGDWVIREACTQMASWAESGLDAMSVSVNVSSRQFRHGDLVATVGSALADSGLAAHQLDVEITESTLLADVDTATEALERLRAMGVRVSVDDFGTGYSSLSYLKRLPIDSLKIDRAFVNDITDDGDGFAISAAIISLARALKLDVVAEGAETAEQVESLRRLGCKKIQGFYFSKPLPARQAEGYIERFAKQSALRTMTEDGKVIVA